MLLLLHASGLVELRHRHTSRVSNIRSDCTPVEIGIVLQSRECHLSLLLVPWNKCSWYQGIDVVDDSDTLLPASSQPVPGQGIPCAAAAPDVTSLIWTPLPTASSWGSRHQEL